MGFGPGQAELLQQLMGGGYGDGPCVSPERVPCNNACGVQGDKNICMRKGPVTRTEAKECTSASYSAPVSAPQPPATAKTPRRDNPHFVR